MEKQQSSIEWLMPNILGLTLELSNNRISQRTCELKILELFKKAKEMEKQQIKNAHTHNRCINNQTYDCTIEAFYNAELYYNEAFGGKDEQ
jgi:hypothetical protein